MGTLLTSFLALMVTGIPVAIAMAGSALVYIWWTGTTPPMVVVHRMISGIDSFPLLAVPFFILAGNLMNNAGITNRIYNFALALVGWMKGGLGHVNIVGSVIFAGMSGTAIADAAGLGTIEIKAMRDHGYSKEFAVGVTAASATLGPDHPAVAAVRDLRHGRQRVDRPAVPRGDHPGPRDDGRDDAHRRLLRAQEQLGRRHQVRVAARGQVGRRAPDRDRVAVLDLGLDHRRAQPGRRRRRRDGAGCSPLDWKFKFEAVLPIITPVLLIGGMVTGIFTPTEGAVAASIWALFLGLVWYRTLSFRMLDQGLDGHHRDDVGRAVHRRRGVDLRLAAHRHPRDRHGHGVGAGFTHTPWVFLLLVNLLLLFVGCFLEPTAAILIAIPVLMPVVLQLGIDPVHFGLIVVLNLMIGLLHPPMGIVLFVLARVAGMSLERTTMAILPWLVPLLGCLLLLTYVPAISLWLPTLVYR